MKEQFVIKHQDGDIVREVRSGSIRFRCDDGTWKVGLELKTCADYDPEGEEPGWDDDDPIIIHLLDYPVGEQDPRAEGQGKGPASAPAASAPAPARPAKVRLTVKSDPAGARVSLDGAYLGETPYSESIAYGEKPGILRVEKEGYEAKEYPYTPDGASNLEATLTPKKPAKTPGPAARPNPRPGGDDIVDR